MSEVECLKKRLAENEIFIKNILSEMKHLYGLVDDLKVEADLIGTEFLEMMKAFK